MRIVTSISILIALLVGSAGSAMADKTWNSDPAIYGVPGSGQQSAPVAAVPVEAVPVNTAPKSIKLYKAPKAHSKSSPKAID